jgi:hypothetical protein
MHLWRRGRSGTRARCRCGHRLENEPPQAAAALRPQECAQVDVELDFMRAGQAMGAPGQTLYSAPLTILDNLFDEMAICTI